MNVAPVLPASNTTLSNWRSGLWHPYGPSMVTVFNLKGDQWWWLVGVTEHTLLVYQLSPATSGHV